MLNTSIITQDAFVSIEYDTQYELFLMRFLDAETDAFMEQDDFKQIWLKWLDLLNSYPCKKVIVDHTQLAMTIAVETQEWVAKHIASRMIDSGVQRYLQILAQDYIIRLSGEQTIDEMYIHNPNLFPVQVSENIHMGIDWLLHHQPQPVYS